MKSYTDLQQSKVLAEILPLESADMCYGIDDDTLKYNDLPWLIPYHKYTAKEFYIPCWSLAALLGVFSKVDDNIEIWSDHEDWHLTVAIYDVESRSLVDACYEMILRLNKENYG